LQATLGPNAAKSINEGADLAGDNTEPGRACNEVTFGPFHVVRRCHRDVGHPCGLGFPRILRVNHCLRSGFGNAAQTYLSTSGLGCLGRLKRDLMVGAVGGIENDSDLGFGHWNLL
jgi:hypothetical protein